MIGPQPRDLTLSIVSHGHAQALRCLLEDLSRLPGLRDTRILLTLNLPGEAFDASTYDSLSIEIVRPQLPRGFGANHNAALGLCRTPWLVVMNPDLRLHDDPFPALLDAAGQHPRAAVLAPRVVGAGGVVEDSVRTNLTPLSLVARHLLAQRDVLQAEGSARRGSRFFWFAGMFLMLRVEFVRLVGGFDERYFMYCEDYDLCARLWNEGFELVGVPAATVTHLAQRDSRRSLRALRWHLASLARTWASPTVWRTMLRSRNP